MQTEFSRTLGIDVPLICGAMYPCSNPELVAAVSEAGGIGIVQPLSLTYVHGYELREGLRYIRQLTQKPIGINFIIEQSSSKYLARVKRWVDIALEEQINFFITALGNPRWIVDKAGPLARWLLRGHRTKHWMRSIYPLQSLWMLKQASLQGVSYKDYFQAGKSVAGIRDIRPAAEIVAEYASALQNR